jgi:hypothetical protein
MTNVIFYTAMPHPTINTNVTDESGVEWNKAVK